MPFERTESYDIWILDADGNRVGEPTRIKTECGAHAAIVLFRRRTGRKAANTRLCVDIEMFENRVPMEKSVTGEIGE